MKHTIRLITVGLSIGVLFVLSLVMVLAYQWPELIKKHPILVNSNGTTMQQVDTSDWLTYKDTELGIEFQHPANTMIERLLHKDDVGRITNIYLDITKQSSAYISMDAQSSLFDFPFSKLWNLNQTSEALKKDLMKSHTEADLDVAIVRIFKVNELTVLRYCSLTNSYGVRYGCAYLVPLQNKLYPNLVIGEGGTKEYPGNGDDIAGARAWFSNEMLTAQHSYDATIDLMISTLKISPPQ